MANLVIYPIYVFLDVYVTLTAQRKKLDPRVIPDIFLGFEPLIKFKES